MTNIKKDDLKELFKSKLKARGFSDEEADLCAEIFTDNTVSGVYSHGINRFPLFIDYVDKGLIKPGAKPLLIKSFAAVEQWDGNFGPGPLNAYAMTNRAMEIADKYGIGCVALRNTNHWMRAGYYGWAAAKKGYIFICWTNTIPNLPPWNGKKATSGNNPIVFAVPKNDNPVVLDMALSQFSYGKLAEYINMNLQLPYYGGYDSKGNLTKDPVEINKTQRALPIGLWKGAGLSLLLDLIASILAEGNSTADLSRSEYDTGMSQVFIAIKPLFNDKIESYVEKIIKYYKSAEPVSFDEAIYYPGERSTQFKKKCDEEGIPIEEQLLEKIKSL
ncbi:3-dehydro-L-gulonate 2-dehydrogenase [Melioribacter sp. OK-6-Me]|uniref:3-dehydro-L-gulonate 2-dehydrogenase n=1 Tax=unclassified Melioribacter TaxID=2627329 RepID=UPI003ED90244